MPPTVNSSPFSHCAAGHDLTEPDAYVYLGGGARHCRQCAIAAKGTAGKRSGWKT